MVKVLAILYKGGKGAFDRLCLADSSCRRGAQTVGHHREQARYRRVVAIGGP